MIVEEHHNEGDAMAGDPPDSCRRRFLQILALAAAAAAGTMPGALGALAGDPVLRRPIPSSGEHIPAVGMGTWLTFDVGGDRYLVADRAQVLRTFLQLGGSLVDSSPMYGSSELVLGECLAQLEGPPPRLGLERRVVGYDAQRAGHSWVS